MSTLPVPRTWVTGEIVTAPFMNGLRDALNFLLNPPYFVGRQTVAQAFTTAVWTAVNLDSEDKDTENTHSATVNTSRSFCNVAGWYSVKAHMNWFSNPTGGRAIAVQINGAQIQRYGKVSVPAAPLNHNMTTSTSVFLNFNDYIELIGWQNSGGNLNTVPTDDGAPGSNPSLSMRWASK